MNKALSKKTIAVAGLGYVGLANAVLLAQHNQVLACDINKQRVDAVNQGQSPIIDEQLQAYLSQGQLDLLATTDSGTAYRQADYIIIATPTDYDVATNYFNTSSVEAVIEQALSINPDALLIIKSTVPVGFTEKCKVRFSTANIVFSPEFLREGKALHDNLYPSRIIVGEVSDRGQNLADLLKQGAKKSDVEVLLTNSTEAEAIKLFSNTYLAMRIAYFNELDTYAAAHDLNSQQIIEGISLDQRIGKHYNNPSFGYGGYCLPKDTKQLLANYQNVPSNMIGAIVQANDTRKEFIAKSIIKKAPQVVGIYRLVMKADSDNFRSSAIQGVMAKLIDHGLQLVIYEPVLKQAEFNGSAVYENLAAFKQDCDLIICNRNAQELNDVQHKVYTRDIFNCDS